jgi:putative oxidoreductase
MKIVVIIARILLGLTFFVFGLNGFLHFIPAPPPSGMAANFVGVLVASNYYVVVFGVQVIAGAMLLLGKYVPLALVLVAGLLVNILTFHITMQPAGLPPGLIATVLWFIVAYSVRDRFASLLAS